MVILLECLPVPATLANFLRPHFEKNESSKSHDSVTLLASYCLYLLDQPHRDPSKAFPTVPVLQKILQKPLLFRTGTLPKESSVTWVKGQVSFRPRFASMPIPQGANRWTQVSQVDYQTQRLSPGQSADVPEDEQPPELPPDPSDSEEE
jgi:hypothetical protein